MLQVKSGGAWAEMLPYVKSAGTWVTPSKIYAKLSGAWKQVWPEIADQPQDFDQTDVGEAESASLAYTLGATNVSYTGDHGSADLGPWVGAGTDADYEFMFSVVSDSGSGSGHSSSMSHSPDVWYSCTEHPYWAVSKDGTNNGHHTLNFVLRLRRAVGDLELRVVTIQIKAQRVPFIP